MARKAYIWATAAAEAGAGVTIELQPAPGVGRRIRLRQWFVGEIPGHSYTFYSAASPLLQFFAGAGAAASSWFKGTALTCNENEALNWHNSGTTATDVMYEWTVEDIP